MEKEGEKMKLGLGKIKEALRSGTAKDTGEGKKEQMGGRRQADKEETQKMVNSEKDSGSLEGVKMKLKRTGQEPQSGSLSPAAVSYTHLRAHETVLDLVCRLL